MNNNLSNIICCENIIDVTLLLKKINHLKKIILICNKGKNIFFSILLFKGLFLFGPDFFWFQNTHTFLGLSRDKTKG